MEEMRIPFQHAGLVTTRAQLAKSPAIARRVIKSFVEGIHLATVNPEIPKKAFRKYLRLQQKRELEDAYQIMRGFLPRKPYPTLEGFKAVRRARRANPGGQNCRPQRFRRHPIP